MSDNKKYYWLKLQKTFFTDKKVKKLRKIAGGEIYTIIYLKLLLESLENNCTIQIEGICGEPAEELELMIDEDKDNIKACLIILEKMNLCQIDKDLITFNDIEKMVGSSTTEADRLKAYREKQKALKEVQESTNDVRTYEKRTETEHQSYPEKEIEIERDIELDKEREKEASPDFQNDSVYDDTTGYYKTLPPYELFINKLCDIQEQLLCITATGIHNLQGFKKPEARENLKKAFDSRRYDWEECVELAFKNAKSKPDVSKHWLEFLGYLKIYLGNGDEKNHSLKRYYTPQELAEKEAKKQQKALELEQQRLEEERKQKEQDILEAEKMGLTLEEYYQKQEEADKDFFETLKKSLFNTYSCDSGPQENMEANKRVLQQLKGLNQ